MEPENGVLVVVRPKGGWRDFARGYVIEIDGEHRGHIRRGETLELAVVPGRHVVRASIAWTGSPEVVVDVSAGSSVTCKVEPAGNAREASEQVGGEDTYLRLEQVG